MVGGGRNQDKIALVCRRRYGGEIGLPKGHVNDGETEAEAALREVEEETGLRATLREAVGATHYTVGGRPKTVVYFLMTAPDDAPARPQDSKEVQAVEWLSPVDAIAALTHDNERALLRKVFAIGGHSR